MEALTIVVAIIATMASAAAALVAFHAYKAQTDPDVIVYVSSDEKRPGLLILVIKNIGNGVAHDITFDLPSGFPDDPAGMTCEGRNEFEPMKHGPLISGIKSLPPKGQRVLNWGQFGGAYDYLGDEHAEINVRFYRRSPLDIYNQYFSTTSYIEVASLRMTDASKRSEAAQLKVIADQAKKTTDEFKKLNRVVAQIRSELHEQNKSE